MKRKTLKEKWEDKDTCCPLCGNVTKPSIGLTRQNILKLFRKPTMIDWLMFLIIILTLLGGYSYILESKQNRERILELESYQTNLGSIFYDETPLNLNLLITNENKTT